MLIAKKRQISAHGQAGFSLIEVMIAVLVLAIGILGAGALQTIGLQTTQGAYFRSQGIVLAEDIADRMRANRLALATYVAGAPAIQPNDDCLVAAGGCTPVELANIDRWNWAAAVANTLPGGSANIVAGANNSYTITVSWSENEWVAGQRQNGLLSTALNTTIFPQSL